MSHGIDLNLVPESIRSAVGQLIVAHDAKEIEIKLLRERLRLILIKKYGPKSEALSEAQLQLLELEPSVHPIEVQTEAAQGDKALESLTAGIKTKLAKPHGRLALPAHLPRNVVTLTLPPAECVCPKCAGPRELIGYEESEQLQVVPARYTVEVVRREKRACHNCPELGVRTATVPDRIIPKGKLSDPFLVEVLVRKYAEHMPIYRQCAGILRDAGVTLSRQTLTDGVMSCGGLMQALIQPMKIELKAGGYIQADETTVPVQSAAVRGRNHQGYLWQYSRPGGPVVFDFQMTRSREGPAKFLEGFEGWLQCDGYGAYDKLGTKIRYAGCLAHARRRFFEASQLAPAAPEPLEVLDIFAGLYAVESEARGLAPVARHELRQSRSRFLMAQLKTRLVTLQKSTLPASKLGEACAYALNQWDRLESFLKDGILEADNNWCENGMRPIALGRRNWLHFGEESAGPKIAAIASIMETCKRHHINLREYLGDVLPRLGNWPFKRVGELTPLSWKACRTS